MRLLERQVLELVWWIVVSIVLVVVLLVLMSDIELKLRIDREGERDRWKLNIRWLYGLVRYTMKIPALKWKGNQLEVHEKQINDRSQQVLNETNPKINRDVLMTGYHKITRLIRNTFEFSRWLKKTLRHIRCRELYWLTSIGAGEAVETATLTGLAWSLKGSIIGYVSKYITLQVQPRLAIEPYYNQTTFATELSCIFKFRTGYAILAGLLLMVRVLRIKGGMKTWRNTLFKAS